MTLKNWLQAARLRTLPLALSCIIVGTACAIAVDSFDAIIFIFAVLTTVFLQVLSNFANDYGDAISGKDDKRIGPERTVQSGKISPNAMKKAMFLFVGLSLLSGLILLFYALQDYILYVLLFIVLGIASIAAAIKYTVGTNPYGYRGLGDLFVFIFFGLVGVIGTYFLYTKSFDWTILLPASGVGLFSVAVLHFNNMRDIENDKMTKKNTLAVYLGLANAKVYQYIVLVIAMASFIIYALINHFALKQYLFLLIYPVFAQMMKSMMNIHLPKDFDPFLKKTALSTFILSILFLIAQFL